MYFLSFSLLDSLTFVFIVFSIVFLISIPLSFALFGFLSNVVYIYIVTKNSYEVQQNVIHIGGHVPACLT